MDPANHLSTQLHLTDVEKCFILEIKADIEKLSKRRTPPISGQFFLHQRCPLIGENTVNQIWSRARRKLKALAEVAPPKQR